MNRRHLQPVITLIVTTVVSALAVVAALTSSQVCAAVSDAPTCLSISSNLTGGSRGPAVIGMRTGRAVIAWQSSGGINATGHVGPATRAAMRYGGNSTRTTPHTNQPTPMPATITHAEFTTPELVTIQGYHGTAEDPFITSDEKYLLFDTHADMTPGTRPGKSGVFYAKKLDYKTFVFVGEIQGLAEEGPGGQAAPAIDTAGNLYFLTGRSHAQNYISIWHGTFADGRVTNLAPVEGISRKQPGWFNMGAVPSRDGRYLYFTDNGDRISNIVVAAKNADETFTRLANSADLMRNVNDRSRFDFDYGPSVSSDDLEFFFTAPPFIYMARRNSTSAPFGVAQRLNAGNLLPTPPMVHMVEGPCVSLDGKHIYYHMRLSPGHSVINVMSR